ncbi:hypothetical protein V8C44DRAFT_47041 [Trichoderma aethiopicum]
MSHLHTHSMSVIVGDKDGCYARKWPLIRRRYQHSVTLPERASHLTQRCYHATEPTHLTSHINQGPLQDAKTGTTSKGQKSWGADAVRRSRQISACRHHASGLRQTLPRCRIAG